ncbi:MAG TPA: hypothetical protein VIU15_18620 [Streptomyces sp.]
MPTRWALERDDASVERWRSEVWETVKPPRRPGTPTSASSCAVRRCDSCGGERPSPLTLS